MLNAIPATTCDAGDAELVARAVAGDRGSFEALYERHHRPLFRTALAMTRDRGVAEELLQEAFLRAYRHLRRVTLDPGASLRPWLHRIVINLSYDWLARQRTAGGSIDGVVERWISRTAVSPEQEAEQHELERIIGDAIAGLPFKQRIVVVLFYLHDMDLIEISEILNLPPGTVKSRLFYGRARLRARLEADARLPEHMELGYAAAHTA